MTKEEGAGVGVAAGEEVVVVEDLAWIKVHPLGGALRIRPD